MKGRGKGVLALACIGAVAAIAASQGQAAPMTHFVDDDLVQCPTAAFNTIQDAVNAANPGDTVRVCPGVYDESVIVNKSITIRGTAAHPDVASCNDTETNPNRAYVTGDDGIPNNADDPGPDLGPGFRLTANSVTLLNLTIEHVVDWPGVYVEVTTSGHKFQSNLFRHNTFGLYLNTSGALPTTVTSNCFRFNDEPGAASGNGIYEDQGVGKVTVSANKFWFNGGGAAMNFTVTPGGPPWTPVNAVTVKGNISTGDEEGVSITASTASVIQGNIINMPANRGIFIGPRNMNLQVKGNIIQNSQGDGIRARADFTDDGYDFTLVSGNQNASLNVNIASNIIQSPTDNGLRFDFSGPGTRSLANSTIQANIVQSAGRDGIWVGNGSRNNKILRNIFQGSKGHHDCHDENNSVPANVWTNNIGKTQNRPNLCIGAAVTPPPTHPAE